MSIVSSTNAYLTDLATTSFVAAVDDKTKPSPFISILSKGEKVVDRS